MTTAIIFRVIPAIDAYLVARKTSSLYRLKEYNRWYFYLCCIFLLSGSYSDFTQRLIYKYIQPVKIISSSMFPTLQTYDWIVVYKKSGNTKFQTGDIIQLPNYEDLKTTLVKRIVACAGDTVEIKNNHLIINDVPLEITPIKKISHQPSDLRDEEPNLPVFSGAIYIERNGNVSCPIFLVDDPNYINDFKKHTVPEDHVFVLGDSRNLSSDSRVFGYIPTSIIQGTAKYLLWTGGDWSRWGLIRREPQPAK
jgi:signal peptidase I